MKTFAHMALGVVFWVGALLQRCYCRHVPCFEYGLGAYDMSISIPGPLRHVSVRGHLVAPTNPPELPPSFHHPVGSSCPFARPRSLHNSAECPSWSPLCATSPGSTGLTPLMAWHHTPCIASRERAAWALVGKARSRRSLWSPPSRITTPHAPTPYPSPPPPSLSPKTRGPRSHRPGTEPKRPA